MLNGVYINHHGATKGVTGSCHELCVDDVNSVLIDCGLFQGAEVSGSGASSKQLEIDFPLDRVRALLVTHCHIDHVGRIPYLLAAGFKGPIYCSEPSAVLLPEILEDAVKIGLTRDPHLVKQFLKFLQEIIVPVRYKEWVDIPLNRNDYSSETNKVESSLSVKFHPAGHILGSSYIECRIQRQKESTKILFSGDLGATYSPLLLSPKSPYSSDVLVIESTYGDRLHENRKERRERLKGIIRKCFYDRGVVLIPAFSIGRTQEILYELEQIIYEMSTKVKNGKNNTDDSMSNIKTVGNSISWSDIDIIVDSPLASRFTDTYRKLKAFWDNEAQRKLRAGRHPLSFEQMITIDSHQEHLNMISYLMKRERPVIVLAASGMCVSGRIVNYLKAFISNPTTDVLFAGYQAEGTPGRVIQQYGPRNGYVEFDDVRYTISAGIYVLDGYSAHADQRMLLNFVKRMRKKPEEIRIVHGDLRAKNALKNKLVKLYPSINIVIP